MTDSFESSSRSRSISSDSRYSNSSSRRSPLRPAAALTNNAPKSAPAAVAAHTTNYASNNVNTTGGYAPPPSATAANNATAMNGSYHEHNVSAYQPDTTGPYPIQVPPDQVPVSYDKPPPRQQTQSARFPDEDDYNSRQQSRGGRRPLAPPDGSVVRIMRPEDFKALFHGTIVHEQQQHHRQRSGGGEGDVSLSPRKGDASYYPQQSHNTSTSARAPAAPSLAQRPASKQRQRDFIDPYRGTTFRHKIVVPKEGDRAASRGRGEDDRSSHKRRAASRLRAQVQEAQVISNSSVVPPKQASYKELGAYQELQELKKTMLRREKEIENLRKDLRTFEEKTTRLENNALKGKSADAASTLQQTLDGLRGKVHTQARRIQELEDDQYQLKQRARASRVGELEHQCAAYIAENRRLASILADMNEITRKGGEAALLQEAQTMLRHKDTTIEGVKESLRLARDDQRRAEAEAQTWRSRWDADHHETEEVRKRLDELRDAPGEILRLRRQIEALNNDKLETVHRDERSKAGAAYEHSHAKQHLDLMTKERDVLLAQIHEKDRVIEAHRTDFIKRSAAMEQDIQQRLAAQFTDERRQFQDREFQLKQVVHDWEKRYKALEEQNVRLHAEKQRGDEHLQLKEQQMQQKLLTTIGKYEQDRTAELHDMDARMRLLKQQQEELNADRARWEAQQRAQQDDVHHVRKSTTQSTAAHPATAAVSAAPSSAPLYPVPSSLGPTHTREHSGNVDSAPHSPHSPPKASVPIVTMGSFASNPQQQARSDAMTPTTRGGATTTTIPPAASSISGRPLVSSSGPSKPATRYDRGEDVPSEVTVRHGQDGDASSVASSILSDNGLERTKSAAPPPLPVVTPVVVPPTVTAVAKPIAPSSPAHATSTTAAATPAGAPAPIPVKVPLVVPVPSNPNAANIGAPPPPSPAAVKAAAPQPSAPPQAPPAVPIVPVAPVPVAVPVAVPVPVVPPKTTAPSLGAPPPPAVSVLPVTGMSAPSSSPSVPTPAAVAVGVAMANPNPVPVPKPLTTGGQPIASAAPPAVVPSVAPGPMVVPAPKPSPVPTAPAAAPPQPVVVAVPKPSPVAVPVPTAVPVPIPQPSAVPVVVPARSAAPVAVPMPVAPPQPAVVPVPQKAVPVPVPSAVPVPAPVAVPAPVVAAAPKPVAVPVPAPAPVAVPVPAPVAVPVPVTPKPVAVPVPAPAPVPVAVPKPTVGAVAPTKKAPAPKSNDTDSDDDEFVVNEGPGGGDDDDELDDF